MMFNNKNQRIEYKMLLSKIDLSLLKTYVHSVPYFFRKNYSDRFVNSIYYDSLNFQCLEDNLSGVSQRYKSRLRWYHKINEMKNSCLEFKIKNGVLGTKHKMPLALNLNLLNSSHSQIVQSISKSLPIDDSIIYQYNCNPIVIIRYYRSYYESSIKNIRITIDRDFEFYSQLKFNKINILFKRSPVHLMILEIKFSQKHSDCVEDIIQYLPYRVTKCSKYTLAVQSIL